MSAASQFLTLFKEFVLVKDVYVPGCSILGYVSAWSILNWFVLVNRGAAIPQVALHSATATIDQSMVLRSHRRWIKMRWRPTSLRREQKIFEEMTGEKKTWWTKSENSKKIHSRKYGRLRKYGVIPSIKIKIQDYAQRQQLVALTLWNIIHFFPLF